MKDLDVKVLDIFAGRLALIVLLIVVAIVAYIEVTLVFGIKVILMSKAMRIGSILWIVLALVGWIIYLKGEPKEQCNIWGGVFITIFTAISVAGIYIPDLTKFAIWVNSMLSIVLVIVFLWRFPKEWKGEDRATTPAPPPPKVS